MNFAFIALNYERKQNLVGKPLSQLKMIFQKGSLVDLYQNSKMNEVC